MTQLDDPISIRSSIRLPTGRMTEDEFVAWCDDDIHAEWVGGKVQLMSPVSVKHSDVHGFLLFLMKGFASKRRSGQVLFEPVHVRLHPALRRSPDIIYVTNEHADIVQRQVVNGSPDLLIEIVSPGSVSRDYRQKFTEYEQAGVREYWIVNPEWGDLEAHQLINGRYVEIAAANDQLLSLVLPGFYIRPSWLKAEKLPEAFDCLMELLSMK